MCISFLPHLCTSERTLTYPMKVPYLVPSRLGLFAFFAALIALFFLPSRISRTGRASPYTSSAISRCEQLKLNATFSPASYARKSSDRYVPGTRPVLIKRARIWTGGRNGTQVIRGDVLMDKGLIKSVGHLSHATLAAFKEDLIIIDANNSWLTPGLVDMHSHMGNSPAPYLAGASDDWRSERGNIQVLILISRASSLKDLNIITAVSEKYRWTQYPRSIIRIEHRRWSHDSLSKSAQCTLNMRPYYSTHDVRCFLVQTTQSVRNINAL